jgi:5-formyltetrahydrofolate cyclo-ligase
MSTWCSGFLRAEIFCSMNLRTMGDEVSVIAEQKQSLRREAREVLAALPRLRDRSAGMAVLGHLAMWIDWHRAKTVAAYCSLPTEPHVLTPWPEGKTVLLPRIEGEAMDLRVVRGPDELVEGKFGIPGPRADAPRAEPAADFILVPGLAFDPTGARLGRGGGFYDRFLAGFRGVKVGVCFAELVVDGIPEEPHDIRMDFIATEEGIIFCGPGNTP